MIISYTLKRFKCFDEETFDLNNLTIFSGINGTGKSTAIQSLLLLRQGFTTESFKKNELPLNGEFVKIGTGKDALFAGSSTDSISFQLRMAKDSGDIDLEWIFSIDPQILDQYFLKGEKIQEVVPTNGLFAPRFQYIKAERIGPRTIYSMSELPRKNLHVGGSGEFVAHFISEFSNDSIPNKSMSLKNDRGDLIHQFDNQLQLWMRKIIPNLSINFEKIAKADMVKLGMKVFDVETEYMRPTNMGFGTSYVLPIIAAALMAESDSMLIVENPEAHLHPAGQSEIGKILSKVASLGVQVIVETHSDHVLNGIRIAVKQKIISHEKVNILHFSRGESLGSHEVNKLKIYEDGGIDPWPDKFFDQYEKDLEQLF